MCVREREGKMTKKDTSSLTKVLQSHLVLDFRKKGKNYIATITLNCS